MSGRETQRERDTERERERERDRKAWLEGMRKGEETANTKNWGESGRDRKLQYVCTGVCA